MTKYLSNAFSLQMLTSGDADINVIEVDKSQVPFGELISTIGHQDIADILGVPMNRVNTRLQSGDILYVAQYIGDRLPEGVTTLPEDATIKFFKITVNYNIEAVPQLCWQYKRTVADGRFTKNIGEWKEYPDKDSWGYILAFNPNTIFSTTVFIEHVKCLQYSKMTREDFNAHHSEYIETSLEDIIKIKDELLARLTDEAFAYVDNAVNYGIIEVREFVIYTTSARMEEVDGDCVLLQCADKNSMRYGEEFAVPTCELQNVLARKLPDYDPDVNDDWQMQILYHCKTNGQKYWCNAINIDFE